MRLVPIAALLVLAACGSGPAEPAPAPSSTPSVVVLPPVPPDAGACAWCEPQDASPRCPGNVDLPPWLPCPTDLDAGGDAAPWTCSQPAPGASCCSSCEACWGVSGCWGDCPRACAAGPAGLYFGCLGECEARCNDSEVACRSGCGAC